MSTGQDKVAGLSLKTYKDWDSWLAVVKLRAVADDIWTYCDPDLPDADLAKPIEPPIPVLTDNAVENTKLTAQWTMENAQYTGRTNVCNLMKKLAAGAREHILKTIDSSLIYVIEDQRTNQGILRALKKHLEPEELLRVDLVREKYWKHLRSIKRTGLHTWIEEYERIMIEALKVNIQEVQQHREQVHGVLSAIRKVSPDWAKHQILDIFENPDQVNRWPTGLELAALYRTFITDWGDHATDTEGSYGSFTSYQGRNENKNSNGDISATYSTKAKRTKPACLCGGVHWYSECFYFVKGLRPTGWVPKPGIEAKAATTLKVNEGLQNRIRKIEEQIKKTAASSTIISTSSTASATEEVQEVHAILTSNPEIIEVH
jgi:hypothetical protein